MLLTATFHERGTQSDGNLVLDLIDLGTEFTHVTVVPCNGCFEVTQHFLATCSTIGLVKDLPVQPGI